MTMLPSALSSTKPLIAGPVLFPFTGAIVGGSHISTFNLAKSLTEDYGIETTVIAIDGSGIAAQAHAMGLKVHAVAGPAATERSILGDAKRLGERRKLLANFGTRAILHCNDLWTLQAWGLAGRLSKMAVIYHHRAFENMHWVNRSVVGIADEVICISDACRRNLALATNDRVTNILNPFPDSVAIDARKDRAEFDSKWPSENGIALIGFAANFQARKRPQFFLDVCRVLAKEFPHARFVMFGRDRDVTSSQIYAHAAQLGIADRVHVAGFRSPPERNLAPLDVLVAPALAEPFGRTLVEALLVGTPYVATDDSGHTEIYSRWAGGKLVAASAKAEEFAAEVANVITHPESVRIPARRLKEITEELSPRVHAAKVCDIYLRALAKRH